MKTRKTKLDLLKSKSCDELFPLVIELEREILDFYIKYDIFYYQYEMYQKIMKLLISDTYYTYDEIADKLCVDRMVVYRFIKRMDDFVLNIILHFAKYDKLKTLL